MIYTDKIHLIADSLEELYDFCKEIGIKKCWFEGIKKGHPHYDLPKKYKNIILNYNVLLVTNKEIVKFGKLQK